MRNSGVQKPSDSSRKELETSERDTYNHTSLKQREKDILKYINPEKKPSSVEAGEKLGASSSEGESPSRSKRQSTSSERRYEGPLFEIESPGYIASPPAFPSDRQAKVKKACPEKRRHVSSGSTSSNQSSRTNDSGPPPKKNKSSTSARQDNEKNKSMSPDKASRKPSQSEHRSRTRRRSKSPRRPRSRSRSPRRSSSPCYSQSRHRRRSKSPVHPRPKNVPAKPHILDELLQLSSQTHSRYLYCYCLFCSDLLSYVLVRCAHGLCCCWGSETWFC